MKPYLITFALGIACCGAAAAQTVLTLDDCRRLAVENNARVRMADGDRQAAREVSREAFTRYFPDISASWLGFRSNKGAFQYTLPSVGQLLPAGAEALIPPEFAGLADQSLGEIDLIKKGWTGSVYALQPVFMGGRIVNGNKLARIGEKVAELQRDNTVDDVTVTAEQYYWQVVTLQSKRLTLQSVLAMVDTLEYQVGVAVDAGVAMPNDLLKVRLQRNELCAAQVDLDNGIALATNLLAQYVGLAGDSIAVRHELAPQYPPSFPAGIYVEPALALASTADYRLLELGVDASELKTKLAQGENMPAIALGAGWMYDDLFSEKHNFAAAMLTVSVPITGWWGGSHKIKKSRIEEKNARIRQNDLEQMLVLKMQNAWDDLTASHRKLAIAHEAIGQATENLRLNENYYGAGVSTISDLLDAQTLYRQSLDRYTESYGSYRLSRVKYLQATGQLGPGADRDSW